MVTYIVMLQPVFDNSWHQHHVAHDTTHITHHRGAVMAEAAHEVLGAEGPSDGAGPGNTGLPPPPPGPPPRVQLSTKDLKMLHKAMKKQEKKEKKSKKSKKEKHKKKVPREEGCAYW